MTDAEYAVAEATLAAKWAACEAFTARMNEVSADWYWYKLCVEAERKRREGAAQDEAEDTGNTDARTDRDCP